MNEDDARTRTCKLRDALEDDIANGRLRPGDRLDEVGLAERFGVSRTPIREALQQLSATGLVKIAPKKGAYVAEISLPRLIEMFEVMAELEGMCGRLCARRMTRSEYDALVDALQACQKAAEEGDTDTYYYENERFHTMIYQGCHNEFLGEQSRQLHMRLKPYRRLQLRVRNRVSRSLQEHEEIIAAIHAGDEARAEASLKAHIVIQGERFTDFVASIHRPSKDSESDESLDRNELFMPPTAKI